MRQFPKATFRPKPTWLWLWDRNGNSDWTGVRSAPLHSVAGSPIACDDRDRLLIRRNFITLVIRWPNASLQGCPVEFDDHHYYINQLNTALFAQFEEECGPHPTHACIGVLSSSTLAVELIRRSLPPSLPSPYLSN